MTDQLSQLQPAQLWRHFEALNAVPRASKKEARVIEFIRNFAEDLRLPCSVDDAGNVLVKKPATAGMEHRETIVLQSHLDMVHQKNADTAFDFSTQGISMFVEGDWVKATGTTLGADNGIGVASIMTVLESTDIPHPAIEALFTIDEETGMTGALSFKGDLLSAGILLNLDTEEDNELTIGCAGGIDVTASGTYTAIVSENELKCTIALKGLTGGHSGVDIHKGRANANKLLTRILLHVAKEFSADLIAFDGGSLRNAIPREAVAELMIRVSDEENLRASVKSLEMVLKSEYGFTDPQLNVAFETSADKEMVMPKAHQAALLRVLHTCPNGIHRMSPDIDGLVQSSNNIARVMIKNGEWSVQCLTRSSVDSEKMDLAAAIGSAFELANGTISVGGVYPGWTPRPEAPIVQLMSDLYKELFNEPAHVNAVHAGLECGILGTHYPDMQMISFGPNIYGAHSPDEKVQISSVQKFWKFFLQTLKRIPEKK
ncbi:MAG: aminoacyl-histidine dipeptidase [Ferruginibacter sp.]|nr:aminoacyl-histidine dipeptidase [Ferruginibacter sp.]